MEGSCFTQEGRGRAGTPLNPTALLPGLHKLGNGEGISGEGKGAFGSGRGMVYEAREKQHRCRARVGDAAGAALMFCGMPCSEIFCGIPCSVMFHGSVMFWGMPR